MASIRLIKGCLYWRMNSFIIKYLFMRYSSDVEEELLTHVVFSYRGNGFVYK